MSIKNYTAHSYYTGNVCAISFKGDDDYQQKGFNFLSNFAGVNPVNYFGFKYCVLSREALEAAYKSEGRSISNLKFHKKHGARLSEEKEMEKDLAAEEFAATYAQEKMNELVNEGFMNEISRARTVATDEHHYSVMK